MDISTLKVKTPVRTPEPKTKEPEEHSDDFVENVKDKLKHFSLKKQKEDQEQPQEYQSQQPMSAPKEENKDNFDFTAKPSKNYKESSDSLQSLYNRK